MQPLASLLPAPTSSPLPIHRNHCRLVLPTSLAKPPGEGRSHPMARPPTRRPAVLRTEDQLRSRELTDRWR